MKKYFLLFFCLISNFLFAQTNINGVVTDKKGNPLQGVNISLRGTYDGASSKADGTFIFKTKATGKKYVRATYLGFETDSIEVDCQGNNIQIAFSLKEKINKLNAVVISAGSFEASDEKKGTTLTSLDMVTTAGSNGDNFSAMKTLPGTQQTNDREGLFVRGGTGNETQTYIDGTLVRNPFGVALPDLGARGRFSPFLFKGTIFSTGGYSALYGQAMSSAVILKTIDLPEKTAGNASISSIGAGIGLQQLSKNKNYSYGVNYNYVNLSPYFKIIKQNIDFFHAPTAHQFDANYRIKTSKGGMFKIYAYTNSSQTGMRRENLNSLDYNESSKIYYDKYEIKNENNYINFSYQEFFSKNWNIQSGLCMSYNRDFIHSNLVENNNILVSDTNFLSNNTFIYSANFLSSAKVVLEHDLNQKNTLRFGSELIYRNDAQNIDLSTYALALKAKENLFALFAEDDFYFSNELAGKLGVRAEYSTLLQKMNFAPRLSLAYKFSDASQLSFASGRFYQNPDLNYLYSTQQRNYSFNYQFADHFILNYLYQKNKRIFRIESYYKNYHQLIKNKISHPQLYSSTGNGYARGLELFYRDKTSVKGLDFWISYSFIDSKRDYLDYPFALQPDFVANHVASLVFKKFWVKQMFGINGTYTFSSGRPYTNPNENGFLNQRTENYHNISISCNYIKKFKDLFSVWVISINNPFGFKQVYGYKYASQDLNKDGVFYSNPIQPAARQFVFLGVFFSWGIDRTEDAINNNL